MTEEQLQHYATLHARYVEAATHCASIADVLNRLDASTQEFTALMPAYLEALSDEQAAGRAITAYGQTLQDEGVLV